MAGLFTLRVISFNTRQQIHANEYIFEYEYDYGFSVLQYMYWLIRRKARVRDPGQASKQDTKKYSFGDFLSADFWQKLCKRQ